MDRVTFLSMVFMVISCIAGFAIPIILFIYFRKKKRADTLIVILNGFHVPLIFVELIFGVVSIIVALFSRKIYVEES